MTYRLDKPEKAIQKAALEFAKGEFVKDVARQLDKDAAFPESTWKKAAELGFIGTHLPENLNGGGLGHLENVLVAEAFARIDSTTGAAIMLAGVPAEWLACFGSKKQNDIILPPILEGRMLPGVAFIQPDTVNDDNRMIMQEIKPESNWLITGEVDGIINAKFSNIFFIVCANASNSRQPDGISMLVVEADRPGIRILQNHDLLGLRMTGSSRLSFDSVSITPENLIGKEGQGVMQLNRILPQFRLLLAALALGTAQGAFDNAMKYIKDREQFGQKIAQFEVSRHKIAHMALKLEQARCLIYQAALQLGSMKKIEPTMTTLANLSATRSAVDVSSEAIQLMGGYGYTAEYDVERNYRDAKTLQLLSGHGNRLSDEVAAAMIGKLKKKGAIFDEASTLHR